MNDKAKKPQKLRARLPRGLADRGAAELAALRAMTDKIRSVYERYGFDPVETPAFEYTDALGKFLPDQDRPNEGVFSFQDDDEQWISLRYDLTAPLARYVAENYQHLPMPYRSYRAGYVYRNEKPGPGRFRQFMQFDADTVGSASPAADAEMCMMAADAMEELGFQRGQYVVKVNSRKILDGVLEAIGLGGDENAGRRLTVLRALDKFDRLGTTGVRELLSKGRKDESGDFTKGADLNQHQIEPLMRLLRFNEIYSAIQNNDFDEVDTRFPNPLEKSPSNWDVDSYQDGGRMRRKADELKVFPEFDKSFDSSFGIDVLGEVALLFDMNKTLATGLKELAEIESLTSKRLYAADADSINILIDPSVVRGLEYYTGAVFEVELLMPTPDEKGRPVRFGSVGGGGRYDGLVSRFMGQPVPATGFSIGVSRLQAALELLNKDKPQPKIFGPVVVTVFGGDIADYQAMVAELRSADIRAELYLGNPKHSLGQQLKYADKRNSPLVITQGTDERAANRVQINDLIAGAGLADIADREEYLKRKAASLTTVPRGELVSAVQALLAKHGVAWS